MKSKEKGRFLSDLRNRMLHHKVEGDNAVVKLTAAEVSDLLDMIEKEPNATVKRISAWFLEGVHNLSCGDTRDKLSSYTCGQMAMDLQKTFLKND